VADSANGREENASSGRVCLLMLGMHRSGTSALSRVLALLGADLPDKLFEADESNQAGYWEPVSINTLDNELLASAGSAWNDWLAFDPGWYASPKAGEFKARALAALTAEYGTSSFFVLKDPRICRLAPFWFDVLETAGIRPLVLLPLRNPLEVAASLEKRDGTPPELGHLLWLRHALEAEAASRGRPRLHCSYDELMTDWPRLAARTSEALNFSWPRAPERAAPEIDAFLAEGLRHHREAPQRVAENPALSAWLRETHAILARWAAEGENPADFPALDRIRAAFDDAAPAFARLVATAMNAGITERARAGAQKALRDALNKADAEKAARAQAEAALRAAQAEAAAAKAAKAQAETQAEAELKAAQAKADAEEAARTQAEAQLAAPIDEIATLSRLLRENEAVTRQYVESLLAAPRHARLLPAPLRLWLRMAAIRRAGLFDAEWYAHAYADVAAAGMDPLRHFVQYGAAEGRAPNPALAGVRRILEAHAGNQTGTR